MAKKRFKDTGVGKFLLEKIPNVVGAIAGDTPVGSVIQAIIGGSDMSEADKKIALKKLDIERAEIDGTTRRWVADATSGSWLAANVRPLTLVFLIMMYCCAIVSTLLTVQYTTNPDGKDASITVKNNGKNANIFA